jgi:hypothetical protein
MRSFFSCFLLAFLGCGVASPARSDPPPPEMLDTIFPVLRGKKPAREPLKIDFVQDPGMTTDALCGLKTIDLVESRGTEVRTFKLLGEPAADNQPTTLLIRLRRMTVNADGSERAYHPDDPFGRGSCEKPAKGQASKACALDYLSNAEIHVYENAKRILQFNEAEQERPPVPNPAFAAAWGSLWADIAARTDRWVDLGALFGPKAPDETKLYYSKDTDRAVTFDTDIIPFKDGYPCQYADNRHEFFVAATKAHPAPPPGPKDDACRTAGYLNSGQIPFFVLPGGVFTHLTIGDVAIGMAVSGQTERLVYGVVGDVGPRDQIGEGSIQFVRQVRGSTDEPKNSLDTGRLDIKIDTTPGSINALSILVLGGTAKALGFDYSRQNIEKIGRQALQSWQANRPKRLQTCANAVVPNPLEGFEAPPRN